MGTPACHCCRTDGQEIQSVLLTQRLCSHFEGPDPVATVPPEGKVLGGVTEEATQDSPLEFQVPPQVPDSTPSPVRQRAPPCPPAPGAGSRGQAVWWDP